MNTLILELYQDMKSLLSDLPKNRRDQMLAVVSICLLVVSTCFGLSLLLGAISKFFN